MSHLTTNNRALYQTKSKNYTNVHYLETCIQTLSAMFDFIRLVMIHYIAYTHITSAENVNIQVRLRTYTMFPTACIHGRALVYPAGVGQVECVRLRQYLIASPENQQNYKKV